MGNSCLSSLRTAAGAKRRFVGFPEVVRVEVLALRPRAVQVVAPEIR